MFFFLLVIDRGKWPILTENLSFSLQNRYRNCRAAKVLIFVNFYSEMCGLSLKMKNQACLRTLKKNLNHFI